MMTDRTRKGGAEETGMTDEEQPYDGDQEAEDEAVGIREDQYDEEDTDEEWDLVDGFDDLEVADPDGAPQKQPKQRFEDFKAAPAPDPGVTAYPTAASAAEWPPGDDNDDEEGAA